MAWRRRKERSLGVARGKRRYDLPLGRNEGAFFLILLVGLMTFLATLALAASFALSGMSARWSTGLQDRVTVEVPAQDAQGHALSHDDVGAMTAKLAAILESHPAVAEAHILSDSEIADLVGPWLGNAADLKDVPVPGLISLKMKSIEPNTYAALRDRIAAADPQAQLDTHEEWLHDLLRFTGALQWAAALLTIVISVTTAAAVSSAVRARMAVHREEIEILHLMGAADDYISRQFQRHAIVLSLEGALAGLMAGALFLLLAGGLAGDAGAGMLPDFRLQPLQMLALAGLPAAACTIAALTAQRTVNGALQKLP